MKLLVFLFGLFFSYLVFSQNVGISNTAITPDASAGLEVRYTDKGVLIPRVALTQTTSSAPITSPATSLLVYNTATINDVTPGYYYWDGTRWVRFFTGPQSEDWTLLGNAGTNPSTNFLGTTDAQDLVFRTNNTEKVRIQIDGDVGIGTANPLERLHVMGTGTITRQLITADATGSGEDAELVFGEDNDATYGMKFTYDGGTNQLYLRGFNTNYTTDNDPHIAVNRDNGYVGINTTTAGGFLEVNMNNNEDYFQVSNNNNIGVEMRSGTSAGTPFIDFSNDASTDYDARIRLTGNDYLAIEGSRLGVGTTTPTEMLQVAGNANATGYITAGSASTGTITRYGTQTVKWEGAVSIHGTTYTMSIGTFVIPNNIPSGTTIYIDRIVWESDGYHTDGNEDYAIHVNIGSSSYYGWYANAADGPQFIDWHYDSGPGSYTSFTTNQTVRMRLYDDDPWLGGSDDLRVFMMHVTFYYHYNSPLQSGDIAASGRIYANNNEAIGDLAEHFEYSGPIEPGLVVSYLPGTDNEYVLCEEPYSNHIAGVISENPSVVLNSPNQGVPLALAGRVFVKLIDSDELIKGGDFITSSFVPGYAMKATKPGPVIGYAVKNQKAGENFVEILLQPGKFYVPPAFMDFDDRPDANLQPDNNANTSGNVKTKGKSVR